MMTYNTVNTNPVIFEESELEWSFLPKMHRVGIAVSLKYSFIMVHTPRVVVLNVKCVASCYFLVRQLLISPHVG